jgi:aurora kinase
VVTSGYERECVQKDFKWVSKLGEGGFGKVYLGEHLKSTRQFAVKVVSKDLVRHQKMENQIRREVKIMYSLDHPNIIRIRNHFEDDDNLFLIMEYAHGTELYKALQASPRGVFAPQKVAQVRMNFYCPAN